MKNARNSSSNQESLEETRGSSRTFGCVGFSIVAHLAFLAALAVIPETIRSTGGDDAGGRESGVVSLIDSSSAAAESTAANAGLASDPSAAPTADSLETLEASVLTDPQSDIVMPVETAIVVKPKVKVETAVIAPIPQKKVPAPKPVVAVKVSKKSAAQPVAKTEAAAQPVMEEENEAAPVLLANPPSDDQEAFDAKAEPVADEEEQQQPEPVKPVAPVKEESAPVKPVAVAKQEAPKQEAPKQEPKKEEPKKATVVAAPSKGENESSKDQSAKSAASSAGESAATDKSASRSSEGSDENSNSGGTGGQGGTATNAGDSGEAKEGRGESNGAVAGPIRDASELKALPGNPHPVYPARDRLARKEGTSVVLGRVSADGRVSEVTVERSSGSQNMDSASAQAFRSWRFQGGQPGWVRKPFQFKLVGDAKEIPAPLGKALKR